MNKFLKFVNVLKFLPIFIVLSFLFSCSNDFDIDQFVTDTVVVVEASNTEVNGDKLISDTKIEGHEEGETFKLGTELTLTTKDKIEYDGQVVRVFSHWQNDKGVKISTSTTTSVKVKERSTFTAVYLTFYRITFVVEGETDQVLEYKLPKDYDNDFDYNYGYDRTGKDSFILDAFYLTNSYEKSDHFKNMKEIDIKKEHSGGAFSLYGKYFDKKTLTIKTQLKSEALARVSLDLNSFITQNKDELDYSFLENAGTFNLLIYYAENFNHFNLPAFKELPGIYQKGYKVDGRESYLNTDIDPKEDNLAAITIEYAPIVLNESNFDKVTEIFTEYTLDKLTSISFSNIFNKIDENKDQYKVNLLKYETNEVLQGFTTKQIDIVWAYLDQKTNSLYVEMRGKKLYALDSTAFNKMTNLSELNLSSWYYKNYFISNSTDFVKNVESIDKFKDETVANFNYGVINNLDYNNLNFSEKTDFNTLFNSLATFTNLKHFNVVNLFFASSAVEGDINTFISRLTAIEGTVSIYGKNTTKVKDATYN